MSDIAIRVEGLGKRYRIGERERYKALRDVITDGVASPFRKLRGALSRNGHRDSSPTVSKGSVASNGSASSDPQSAIRNPQSVPTSDPRPLISDTDSSLITHHSSLHSEPPDTFWALKDVSFEVKRGEVIGIIGRNGAGKSTLLKILSRITAPTTGEVEIKGRVGSLLEVGTGFHPELTGRENIYLNGAILGMKRAEINRKFDEMVAFAEIEKFIDTPVKRYSSGMYVRLAFAVAAHLEPEILVIDEVLAVGDAQFQKKCLGKIGDVAKEGRTVLFVSHNMAAIQGLCPLSILLDDGVLERIGSSAHVVNQFLMKGLESEVTHSWQIDQAHGDETFKLISARVCQPSGQVCRSIDITRAFEILIETEASQPFSEIGVVIKITDRYGQLVLETSDLWTSEREPRKRGICVSACRVPPYTLNAGKYIVSIAADIPTLREIFSATSVLTFTVDKDLCPLMSRYGSGSWSGVIGPGAVHWSRKHLSS